VSEVTAARCALVGVVDGDEGAAPDAGLDDRAWTRVAAEHRTARQPQGTSRNGRYGLEHDREGSSRPPHKSGSKRPFGARPAQLPGNEKTP
jgi:hypothetical protein